MSGVKPQGTRVLLLGDPVRHSLSAVFQNAAFSAAGMAARYVARRVPDGELAIAVARIRDDPHVLGANVTIPHKLTIGAHLDRLAGDAATLQAVNTISRAGNALVGNNTDRLGFTRALDESGYRGGGPALLLGAGGAARAVAAALDGRADLILIASRVPERAQALCDLLRLRNARPIAYDQVDGALEQAELVVNATPIGLDGRSLPLDPRRLRASHVVVDLVYNPPRTPLLEAARAARAQAVNGLGMLLYQGAAAFELWTGRPPPLAVMREALEAAAGPIH